MKPDEIVEASMQIILDAGACRAATHEAVDAVAAGDFDKASALLDQADDHIRAAHSTHTAVIQAEARGEATTYSMLFAHAQDTLMTTYSELRLIRKLEPVLRGFDARLAALEARQ